MGAHEGQFLMVGFRQKGDVQTRRSAANLERNGKFVRQHAPVIFCLPQVEAGTLFDIQNAEHW